MRYRERKLRQDIASRLHLIASAIEDGTIDLRHLGMFMIAVPERFIPKPLIQRYRKYEEEVLYGTVTQHAATGSKRNETGANADRQRRQQSVTSGARVVRSANAKKRLRGGV